MSLLELKQLRLGYGAIEAVHDVSLTVDRGEVVSLIGANGAGKSTTLKGVAGLLALRAGSVHFAGERIDTQPAHGRVSRGLALVPEGRGIFPRLTIEENLLMGAFHRRDKQHFAADLRAQYELFTRLAERRNQLAGTLSGGEQQMLAISRALMSRPQMMLLDEPSMGLAPIMIEKIFSVIRQVASEGMSILLVEQNSQVALAMAARGYVMEHGEIILADSASALLHNPQVQSAYLGI